MSGVHRRATESAFGYSYASQLHRETLEHAFNHHRQLTRPSTDIHDQRCARIWFKSNGRTLIGERRLLVAVEDPRLDPDDALCAREELFSVSCVAHR